MRWRIEIYQSSLYLVTMSGRGLVQQLTRGITFRPDPMDLVISDLHFFLQVKHTQP